jgi:hypothetical protein
MIEPVPNLDELRARGAMTWVDEERAWMARPDDVVNALSSGGFQEYKSESIRSGRDREPTGGVWQGLNASTGAVASAVWVRRNDDEAATVTRDAAATGRDALVFIDIDGERVTGH